ncbi:MAG: prepilin-type N-terminal cleavage/methylation domain-containing protein [Candidatus Wallbacteria bacterium]|nr:prepilin-type N-terminal cleavage/methylation domain-containing protein [Candidatus Wallbacteria bacterium]
MSPNRAGHTLVEVLVAALLGLMVLVAALFVQHHASITVDSSQRKMTAAAATDLALERMRQLLANARRVWLPPQGSPMVQEQLRTSGLAAGAKPALLYADGVEVFFAPASGRLFFAGEPLAGIRLARVEFVEEGDELAVVLAADEAAVASGGRPAAWREQSVVTSRFHLRVQADARVHADVPETPHDWCLGAEPLDFRRR